MFDFKQNNMKLNNGVQIMNTSWFIVIVNMYNAFPVW